MSTTPPPPPAVDGNTAGGPSPLQVGMRFVKQYYNTISTSPDHIVRFYEPTLSTLSVGRSNCDSTQVMHEAAAARFSEAFFDAEDATATSSSATAAATSDIRFEFERGAIDAQASVNNAILVVATGSVVSSQHENGSSAKEMQKAFVHTFFLGSTTVGTKRSYYIHNDILRFLEEPELSVHETKTNAVAAATTGIEEEVPVEAPVTKVSESVAVAASEEDSTALAETTGETIQLEEPPTVVRTTTTTKDQAKTVAATSSSNSAKPASQVVAKTTAPSLVTTTNEDAPGRGVEETKEAILADEENTPRSRTVAPVAKPNWASVARAQTAAPTPPATPARSVVTDKAENTSSNSHKLSGTPKSIGADADATSPKATAASSTSPSPAATATSAPTAFNKTAGKGGGSGVRPVGKQRDSECTLVIKNIDPETVESEIRALFEPFATVTQSKVVGCTVSSNRGIAFVDYDSSEPVVKAVDQQLLAAFYVRERKLEIYQKTAEQRPRSNVRVGGRGDGTATKSGSGRGRDFRRKNSGGGVGGRGDRGGGGGRSGRDGGGRGRGSVGGR